MPSTRSWYAILRNDGAEWNARHLFMLSGLLLALGLFSGTALIGISEPQAIERWGAGAGKLTWLGLAAACVVLLYTAVLWRVMGYRENIERELKDAKEAAEQANAARGAFLSTMSHEMRTPMNAVIGMAGLLRETLLGTEQKEFTKTIEESASALMEIIDEILDFSRIDAGKLRIEAIDCDLLAIVESSLDVLAVKARKKGLRLMSYVDPTLPMTVSVDSGRLRQILLNLIGNSVKFTPSGDIIVRAYSKGQQHGKCLVRFEVADTGIGIGAENIARLFIPFAQADSSVTRKYGGTGLGLSICKRLLELMGGTIGFDSQAGAGSLFWFELPLPVVAPSAPLAMQTIRVMVVEPHRMQADILLDYAQAWGMQVSVVNSATEALKLYQAGDGKQVVLLAAQLSDMAPAMLMAALSARKKDVRCVLLADSDAARDAALAHGFHAVLVQPIKQSALFDALVLERRQTSAPVVIERRIVAAALDVAPALDERRLILLVEDNIMNQKVAIRQLNLLGYAVDVANHGQEALDAMATAAYALVLMDCQMPVMDGFETTRRIRQAEQSSGGHIQIVAMTANAMQGDRELCLDAGMDDYLAKPILRERLAALLAQRLPQDEAAPTPTPPASTALMLNISRLCDMFGDDKTFQQEMLELFISTTRPLFDQLKHAIDNTDFTQVKALAHRLDGSCANLGIEELAELARAAVRAGHASDVQRLKQLHGAMLAAFVRLCDFVNRNN